MNFQTTAPKIPPRILCIGMPVRDLTFRIDELPARGFKVNASHFDEISGGNALNAAIGIVRLGGRASICGPMGDARETSSRYIFDKLAHEGIDTTHIVRMPGLVTPISNIMIDPSGERTIVTFRDPELWKVELPDTDKLLEDCSAILTENRCAEFCTDLCAEARRRGIPVVVDVDRTMSLREGLLTASSHLVFSSEALQATAGVADDGEALKRIAKLPRRSSPARRARRARSGSTNSRICSRRRRFRYIPWTRSAPAMFSTAHSRLPSPNSRICARRCALPRPPPRSNAPASGAPLPPRNALKLKNF